MISCTSLAQARISDIPCCGALPPEWLGICWPDITGAALFTFCCAFLFPEYAVIVLWHEPMTAASPVPPLPRPRHTQAGRQLPSLMLPGLEKLSGHHLA